MSDPSATPVPSQIPWWHPPALPVTTTFDFPGWRIDRVIGPCFGLVVRSLGIGRGFSAQFQGLGGGEVTAYTQLLEETRQQAMDRLIYHAQLLRANAIIGMRFDSSEVGQAYTEIVAYGTAVLVSVDESTPFTAEMPTAAVPDTAAAAHPATAHGYVPYEAPPPPSRPDLP